MTNKVSNAYKPTTIELTIGSEGALRIVALQSESPRVLKDMTGKTVKFRAALGDVVIEKTITGFLQIETVPAAIDIHFSESDSRKLAGIKGMDWEAESDGIVFAGGRLIGFGSGVNADP